MKIITTTFEFFFDEDYYQLHNIRSADEMEDRLQEIFELNYRSYGYQFDHKRQICYKEYNQHFHHNLGDVITVGDDQLEVVEKETHLDTDRVIYLLGNY